MGIRTKKKLDGKLCYDLWVRTGSVYKVPIVLANEFNMFSRDGRPYTHQATWLASNEFILDNLEYAYQKFQEVWKVNGEIAKDHDWYRFVAPKIKRLSPKKFDEYMSTHPEFREYV